MTAPDAGDVLTAAGAAVTAGAAVDGKLVRGQLGGLRGELLARARAQRERVSAELTGSLRHVGLVEWDAIVGKLESGAVVRVCRDELPRGCPERRRGQPLDVLILVGNELRRAA